MLVVVGGWSLFVLFAGCGVADEWWLIVGCRVSVGGWWLVVPLVVGGWWWVLGCMRCVVCWWFVCLI